MALRKMQTEKEPVLPKKCRPVTEFNSRLHQLPDDMRDTLRKQTARAWLPPRLVFCGGLWWTPVRDAGAGKSGNPDSLA